MSEGDLYMNEYENMLKEKGASQQQINSKTTQIILSLIAENEGALPSGTAYIVDKIKKDTKALSDLLFSVSTDAHRRTGREGENFERGYSAS